MTVYPFVPSTASGYLTPTSPVHSIGSSMVSLATAAAVQFDTLRGETGKGGRSLQPPERTLDLTKGQTPIKKAYNGSEVTTAKM